MVMLHRKAEFLTGFRISGSIGLCKTIISNVLLQRLLHSTTISKNGNISSNWCQNEKCGIAQEVLGITGMTQRNKSTQTMVYNKTGRATPHTSNDFLAWLKVISTKCDVSRSCIHWTWTPPNVYLWDYLKNDVHHNNPKTISKNQGYP